MSSDSPGPTADVHWSCKKIPKLELLRFTTQPHLVYGMLYPTFNFPAICLIFSSEGANQMVQWQLQDKLLLITGNMLQL